MPRHPHQPTEKTRAEVEALASFGVPHNEIAAYMAMDPKTLRKHYRGELDTAHTKANATVARFLYQAASGQALQDQKLKANYADCVRAAMFWAKTRMQWRETAEDKSQGQSQPIQINFTDAKKPEDDSA